MPNAVRKHIAELLRRDEVLLAREAARLFLQQVDLGAPAAGGVRNKSDEAQAILSDSFQRLGSVVALSLQVGEPGLLSEELQWLAGGLAGRFPADAVSQVDLLSRSFTGACTRSLNSKECNLLDQWFRHAHSGMADLKPLLTEPRNRSHIESSTSQDN